MRQLLSARDSKRHQMSNHLLLARPLLSLSLSLSLSLLLALSLSLSASFLFCLFLSFYPSHLFLMPIYGMPSAEQKLCNMFDAGPGLSGCRSDLVSREEESWIYSVQVQLQSVRILDTISFLHPIKRTTESSVDIVGRRTYFCSFLPSSDPKAHVWLVFSGAETLQYV